MDEANGLAVGVEGGGDNILDITANRCQLICVSQTPHTPHTLRRSRASQEPDCE